MFWYCLQLLIKKDSELKSSMGQWHFFRKTFIALYFAFYEMLNNPDKYRKVMILRSMVATRDAGHLPGTKEEKEDVFTAPYKAIANELFGEYASWNKLLHGKEKIRFDSKSFIRGQTLDNAIILVDEMQNLNFHELDSVITRVGKNSRIIFSGDYLQSDFKYSDDKNGIMKFLGIVEQLKYFEIINFGWEDIVRSAFVRDYIMTKEMLGYG